MSLKEHEKFRIKGPNAKDSEFFEVSFDEDDKNEESKDDKTAKKETSF